MTAGFRAVALATGRRLTLTSASRARATFTMVSRVKLLLPPSSLVT